MSIGTGDRQLGCKHEPGFVYPSSQVPNNIQSHLKPEESVNPSAWPRRFENWSLGVLLVAAGLGLAWNQGVSHTNIEKAEIARLSESARVIGRQLSIQLEVADAAMRGAREDFLAESAKNSSVIASRRLRLLSTVLPGVRTMMILDANGTALASNRDELLRQDFSSREYLKSARSDADDVLHVASPYRTVLGVFSVTLSRAIRDETGAFRGAVTATLDTEYLSTLGKGQQLESGQWAYVAHDNGTIFVALQADQQRMLGMNVDQEHSIFRLYRDKSELDPVVAGREEWQGEKWLTAVASVRPVSQVSDHALVFGVSRSADAVFADWGRQCVLLAIAFAAFALCAWMALVYPRRAAVRSAAHRHAELQARSDHHKRMNLALAGADLGLWEVSLATGRLNVDERWCGMLGCASPALVPTLEGWVALLHPSDRAKLRDGLAACVSGEKSALDLEYRARHSDGSWVWVMARGNLIDSDPYGVPILAGGTVQDVSARKKIELQLAKNEYGLTITLESIGDAVISTDAFGHVQRMNLAATVLTGWSLSDAQGRPLAEIIRLLHPGTQAPLPDPASQVLATGEAVSVIEGALLVTRDGSTRAIADSIAPIRDTNNEVQGVVMVFNDVSERFELQRSVKEREQLLNQLANTLPGPISILDESGRHLFVNAAACQYAGVSSEALLGRKHSDLALPANDMAFLQPLIRKAMSGQSSTLEHAMTNAQGRLIHSQVTVMPYRDTGGQIIGCIESLTDISAQVEERERLRALLTALPVGVLTHGQTSEILDVNPAALGILGMTMDQLTGRLPQSLPWMVVDDEEMPLSSNEIPAVLAISSGQTPASVVLLLKQPGGSMRWLRMQAQPLFSADGKVRGAVSTFLDITDVSAQRRLMNLTVDAAELGTWDWHLPSGVARFNRRWWRMLGYNYGEMSDSFSSWKGLIHSDDLPAAQAAIDRHLIDGREPYRAEFRMRAKTGAWIWIMAAGAIVERGADGAPMRMAGIHMDIGHRKMLEKQLAEAALTDALTGLPNRAALFERLDNCLERVRDRPNRKLALLFLDFDHFKAVNDTYGHDTGDELLKQIAQRLRSTLRPRDDVARLDGLAIPMPARIGGDEFVILLEGLHEYTDAMTVANRLLDVLAVPYDTLGHKIVSTASIGIATNSEVGINAADLVRHADLAMYQAKNLGRGLAVVFTPDALVT